MDPKAMLSNPLFAAISPAAFLANKAYQAQDGGPSRPTPKKPVTDPGDPNDPNNPIRKAKINAGTSAILGSGGTL